MASMPRWRWSHTSLSRNSSTRPGARNLSRWKADPAFGAMFSFSTFSDRRGLWTFILGVTAVTAGVLLHAPMFLMGRDMGFRLSRMPMDSGMMAGMGLIVGGVAIAC